MAIETNELIDVKTLSPFKRFIMTIGNLPTSYLESMTYAELLMWFCNYLQETVIPTVNNNAEAVEELQSLYEELRTYVNDYFENLDVQEEINNKLDDMARNGSLTNLLREYIDPIYEAYETRINAEIENQNETLDTIEDLIHQIGNNTPIVVSSTDDMTDTSKIYVNTTDGKWYYYDGDSWEIGGTYQSTGIDNNSVYLSMLESPLQNNFKANMSVIDGIVWNAGGYYNGSGTVTSDTNYSYTSKISVNPKEIYFYPNKTGGQKSVVMFYDDTFVTSIAVTDAFAPFVIPDNVNKIALNSRTRLDRTQGQKILYKVSNYYLNGREKIMYGDMDEAFQNSFVPEYEDITSDLTFTDGSFWYVSLINETAIDSNAANFRSTLINVIPGERYKISGAYLGNVALYQLIGGDNTVSYPAASVGAWAYETKEVTIPDGVYQLNVSGAKDSVGRGSIKVEKVGGYTFTGIDNSNNYYIEQLQEFNIQEQLKNDFKWSNSISSGKYATFTFDDSNADIDQILELFTDRNIPCCFATIPSKLNNTASGGDTIKEVLQSAVSSGCEILSHYSSPLTSSSSDADYNTVYIKTKKTLEENGFKVYGIITTGGTNYNTQDFAKDTKIARNNYFYGDLTASHDTTIEQYWNRRNFLTDGVASAKTLIDNYVAGTSTQPYSKWLNFASHGTSEISLDDLEEVIDYCLSNDIQIVTWKYLYDNFKSSELEKRIEELEN